MLVVLKTKNKLSDQIAHEGCDMLYSTVHVHRGHSMHADMVAWLCFDVLVHAGQVEGHSLLKLSLV